MSEAIKLKRELAFIYDDYRRALLSRKYYSKKLRVVRQLSFAIELVVAISASSSFASLKIAQVSFIVPFLSAFVALVAISKPLVGADKTVERLSRLESSYADVFQRMKRITEQIALDEHISDLNRARVAIIQADLDRLISTEDLEPSRAQLLRIQDEVEMEIPLTSLWWPVQNIDEPRRESGSLQDADFSPQERQIGNNSSDSQDPYL